MSLIGLILLLVVVGVVLWLINSYIPMDAKIKKILNVVVIVVIVLWLINAFVGFGALSSIHIGHIKR
jgi:hypothetical protein